MSYRLGVGQPVSDEIRRIILEEIDSAAQRLRGPADGDRDRRVHEARKSLKKIRAVLRLIQPVLDKAVYRSHNHRLRDVGRTLSTIRDAKAIIEVFDAVASRPAQTAILEGDFAAAIRKTLEEHKRATEENLDVEKAMSEAADALSKLREDLGQISLEGNGFGMLEPGFRKTYQRGRKAMHRAEKHPEAVNLHNWRKRVKDHWYHVRLLTELQSDLVTSRQDDLKKLETWLGDDHNLVVLRETILDGDAKLTSRKQVRQFVRLAKHHGQDFREKAFKLGQHLYSEKPKHLIRDLSSARSAWPDEQIVSASTNNGNAPKKSTPRKPASSVQSAASGDGKSVSR